jgi:hypothetical protein
MGVHVVGEVVDGLAVTEMGVLDHTDAFEDFHRSIDGGEVGARHGVVDPVNQVVGGDVAISSNEIFDDGSARWCDALSLPAKVGEDRLDAIGHRFKARASEAGRSPDCSGAWTAPSPTRIGLTSEEFASGVIQKASGCEYLAGGNLRRRRTWGSRWSAARSFAHAHT